MGWNPFVSIHAPTRGATKAFVEAVMGVLFQFTRPRGARHAEAVAGPPRRPVSIHAPTRGATGSISSRVASASFNSRAHEGRDELERLVMLRQKVSIHAPTRGATQHRLLAILQAVVSIHAPTRGATRT